MKILKLLSIGLIITIIFTGCTNNKLTTAQINDIKSISIHKPKLPKDLSFTIDKSVRSSEVQDAVGAAGGGLLPSLIGAIIDNGIYSYNQSEFEKKYEKDFNKIKKFTIKDLDKNLEAKMLLALKDNEFFNTKILENSSTYFGANIYSYGLRKTFVDQNNKEYLGAKINLEIFLIDSNGKKLTNSNLSIFSKDSYSISKLSDNTILVEELFEQAYENFERVFSLFISHILTNKKT